MRRVAKAPARKPGRRPGALQRWKVKEPAPASAATSDLIVRFPSSIDLGVTITDDQTPVSAVFHNYLASLIEAVMAELGPLDLITRDLKEFLGTQASAQLSCWNSRTKGTGNEAGQLFGIIRNIHDVNPGSGWGNVQLLTPSTYQGLHPAGKVPLVFGNGVNLVPGAGAETASNVGGGVRGFVLSIASNTFTINLRGANRNYQTGPAGIFNQRVDYMVFFMVEAP